MCIQLVGWQLWQYVNVLIITHSVAVKFIACPVQKSQIFADLPHGTNVSMCVCVQVQLCVYLCVLCRCPASALAYFIFQLPAYAHDFNPAASG